MILVPYTALHPETGRLLDEHAPGHVRAVIDPADMSAYWRLMAAAWRQPGELIVVEHDIGITGSVLPGFAACPRDWCGHAYQLDCQVAACLGCTRFSARLKLAEPGLLDVAGEATGGGLPARDWRRLDVRIAGELHRRGYGLHRHDPPVQHFHEYR